MTSTVICPGSYDPITYGHIDAIREAARISGSAVCAIGTNPKKKYLFSLSERENLARLALKKVPNINVTSYCGLLVNFMVSHNFNIVARGLRNAGDLADSMMQDTIGWTQDLASDISVFYVPTRPNNQFVSSTVLKILIEQQGNVEAIAPPSSVHATRARLMHQYMYGITGVSGAGKSTIARKFESIAKARGIKLAHVDMDRIGHDILDSAEMPIYQNVRKQVMDIFGKSILTAEGHINRKALGDIVFGNPEQLRILNDIIASPIFFKMNDRLRGNRGIFLIDAALLAEVDKSSLVDNNILLVHADKSTLIERLQMRENLTDEQIKRRISSQYTTDKKSIILKNEIERTGYGHLNYLDSGKELTDTGIENAFEIMLRQIDIFGELRITSFLEKIGVKDAQQAYETIRSFYASDDRFYHSLSHIVDGIDLIPSFVGDLKHPDALMLAWLFHDAIYDSTASDNEEKSAQLLGLYGLQWGIDPILIKLAQRLVNVTKHGKVKPETSDECWMVDLDMSILGRDFQTYSRYENDVRREYSWATDAQWRKGRLNFLQSLSLQKGRLFYTSHFDEIYGGHAYANINLALQKLRG